MKKIFLLSLSLVLSTYFLAAQSPQWINLIHSDRVHDIAETSQFLWVGTDGGLVQIDKNRGLTTIYNRANSDIPHNKVRSVAIDGDDNVWIGTEIDCYDGANKCFGGITKFDGDNWITYHYKTSESNLGAFFITDIEVNSLGDIWFIERSLSYYNVENKDESKVIRFNEENIDFSVYNQADIGAHRFTDFIDIATENGSVWLTTTFGIFYYNANEWQHFTMENAPLSGNIVSEVRIDTEGNKWFGVYEPSHSCTGGDYSGPEPLGTMKFDGEHWTFYNEGFYLNYENQGVENDLLAVDKNDKVWKITSHSSHFSNWKREGYFLEFDGNSWENMELEGLDYGHIYFIYFDDQNNLWLSTDQNPLIKRDASTLQWENYTISNIPFRVSTYPDFTFDKETDFHSIDRENLYWLKNRTWNSIPINSSVYTGVSSVFFDSNNIAWVALTYNSNKPSRQAALLRVENNEIEAFEIGKNISINSAGIDSKDKIWLYDGNGKDIYTYQNGTLKVDTAFQNITNIVFSEYSNKWYDAFLIDESDYVWIIGGGNNECCNLKERILFYFNGENWNSVEVPQIINDSNTFPSFIQEHEGKLWLRWEDNMLTYHQEEGWNTSISTTTPWRDLKISSSAFQNNGTQWGIQHIFGNYKNLHSIDEELNVATYSYLNSRIAGRSSITLKVDDRQNIWINSYFDGMTIFNPNGIDGIEAMDVIENPRITNEITNIKNEYSDFNIDFYPNPTNGRLNFDTQLPLATDSKIQLLDINGKLVKEWSNSIIQTKALDLSEINEGVYFLYLQSKNISIFEKVIVSRH